MEAAPSTSTPFEIVCDAASGRGYRDLLIAVFVMPVVEEIVFRFSLIGMPEQLLGHSAPAVASLVAVSTVIFALLHLFNFPAAERQPYRVLPQAGYGVLFAFLYLRFGLIAAASCHLLINASLFSVSIWLVRRDLRLQPLLPVDAGS